MTRIRRDDFPAAPLTLSDDDALALLTAAQGFLLGEWFGAVLLLASFAQLYLAVAANLYSGKAALVAAALLVAAGGALFWRSRTYYLRLGTAWGRRWHTAATVVAGSAGIFWLLFVVLSVLVYQGFPVTGK
jgi:hypothetical protein